MRALLIAVAILLAGCSDAPAEVEDDGPPDIITKDGTGAISGVVVTAAIVPIEGATVAMNDQEAMTDVDGAFSFADLDPGLYVMEVSAPQFETIQSTADVRADETSKVRIVLAADPTPVPRVNTEKFEGYIELGDAWATYAGTLVLGSSELCKCSFTADLGPNAEQGILEIFWTPSTAANDPEFYYDVIPSGDADSPSGFVGNPAYEVFDVSEWDEGEVEIVISVATTAQAQQSFEVFWSVWYDGEGPDGWSVQE